MENVVRKDIDFLSQSLIHQVSVSELGVLLGAFVGASLSQSLIHQVSVSEVIVTYLFVSDV